jgi:hypothetical protein
MAHRALKAHTFPEAYGVNLVTKRPRPRQSNSSYKHQLLRDVPLQDRSGVDRSIGETRMGIEIGFKSVFGFILP